MHFLSFWHSGEWRKKSLTNSLSKGREKSLPVSWKTQLENEQTPPDRRPGGAIVLVLSSVWGESITPLHKEHWCAESLELQYKLHPTSLPPSTK